MKRRDIPVLALVLLGGWPPMLTRLQAQSVEPVSLKEYLKKSALSRGVIDTFLDPNQLSWAQYDPELGYILGNYLPQDGIDGSSTISTTQKTGARTSYLYGHLKCRINTYGNSFTQCHQVNDGETWQEYLAAHLGEPIRNFGMGGYGVYQAYRRMLREERSDQASEYVILYVWGDDHLRSLLRCRHALIYRWWDHSGGKLFHNPPWAHVEMNLETGQIAERENLLPTPESLYHMTDAEWMYENLKDDLALQMYIYARGLTNEVEWPKVDKLSRQLGLVAPRRNPVEVAQRDIMDALNKYGFAATKYILTKAREFTERTNKKLLVVLFDPSRVMRVLLESGERYDQEVVDFLEDKGFFYFDMNLEHVKDFRDFRLSVEDYMKRYFIGHYSPAGNHFFAFSIKDTIVSWLDPKPITYREDPDRFTEFSRSFKGFKRRH
jgi:hypothetical protein